MIVRRGQLRKTILRNGNLSAVKRTCRVVELSDVSTDTLDLKVTPATLSASSKVGSAKENTFSSLENITRDFREPTRDNSGGLETIY